MVSVTPLTPVHNVHVLELVPLGARKIFEVGTGSGALAREIRGKCPNVEYVGVEIYEDYADIGRKYCDRVYVENFESPSDQLIDELKTADVVIFADVLEHFMDPWFALERVRRIIDSKAIIIASIPNIQHWSIQYRIMIGDFRYADTGLLDRTHLRFFTRITMVEMFESSGYRVDLVVPRIFDFPGQEAMLEKISDFAKMCGINSDQGIRDAAAFQFVLVASPI